jgi:hypothetical protein
VSAVRRRQAVAVVGLTAWMTLCDHFFHVDTGTVVHFWTPQVDGQTLWVVPLFGLASLAFAIIAPRVATAAPSVLRWVRELGLMTLIYAASGWFGQEHALAVTAAFAALFLLRLALDSDRATVVRLAMLLGITGPAFESLQWALGMFEYTRPDVLGVPWWLFAFYANGVWATRELGALIEARRVKERQPALN